MSEHKIHGTAHLSPLAQAQRSQRIHAQARSAKSNLKAVATKYALKAMAAKGFAKLGMAGKKFQTLERQKAAQKAGSNKGEEGESIKKVVDQKMGDSADFFNRSRNPELNAQTLLFLRGMLKEGDTFEDILQKVLDLYPDYTLADDALDFLLETTKGALHQSVLQAKDELNARYRREIVAGRNIATEAREFSEKGLGSPTALRDMYRDITGNPREVHTLFDELTKLFDYEKMKEASKFLFHSLGADMKAKGPSISRGELSRLLEDTRALQAILGVYFFFKERMKLIYAQFAHHELSYPESLTFEILAQKFMDLLKERYLSSDSVKHLARQLGLSEDEVQQMIIFTQMRDAIRQVSPRLYRNNQHKEDTLAAIIDTLEELETSMDEEEE